LAFAEDMNEENCDLDGEDGEAPVWAEGRACIISEPKSGGGCSRTVPSEVIIVDSVPE